MIIKLLVNGLVIGCIYGLLALGYSLIYKSSGLMSFVQGDFLTMGAYIGLALSRTDLPFYVFVPLTMVTMFIVGMLVERVIIRPLKRKNLPAIFIVLATIALSYIIQNGVQFIWGTTMMWFPSLFNVGKIKAFGLSFTMETIVCVVISIILMVILALFMKYTRLGTSLRASAINPVAAKACGVNVNFPLAFPGGWPQRLQQLPAACWDRSTAFMPPWVLPPVRKALLQQLLAATVIFTALSSAVCCWAWWKP